MPRNYGRTHEEVRASAIAARLTAALADLEAFPGDPTLVLDQLGLMARTQVQGVRDAATALRRYYLDTEADR